ncbi:prepilin-type N-terminal cleavage/methylation domain-containing protein [Lysobacter sp. A3-1-A15]|uniref:prepilin-type N-terminal cleavage/methylation domain-containing protein n=1 Tax=Novilysobacter viscosus TaxID=3098602 RepID=UPI002ED87AA4
MTARRRIPSGPVRGFTLIEVLLATVLLAAGLGLAFATLTASMRTVQRGEAMAERGERERAVLGFLRSRLTGTRPVAFASDPIDAMPERFVGNSGQMRFVADLPDYLGRGGPYLHEFTVQDDGDRVRVVLSLSMVQAGVTVEEDAPVRPEVLVEGLRSATFRFRALDGEGGIGPWQDDWETPEQLPLLVEVRLVDGDGRAWPPLVVALPQAGVGFGAVAF